MFIINGKVKGSIARVPKKGSILSNMSKGAVAEISKFTNSNKYLKRRPFFNRGVDAMDYQIDVFYSRSINNPSFASKIINQGKKSRL